MRLYVLRHAEAEERRPGLKDADRRLTKRGHAQAKAAAELFRERSVPADIRPEKVLSSPAARARETAEPVGAALRLTVEFEPRLGLDCGEDDALELVGDLLDTGEEACVLVGHNPTLEDLVGALGGTAELKKGQLVVLDVAGTRRTPRGREIGRFRADV